MARTWALRHPGRHGGVILPPPLFFAMPAQHDGGFSAGET
ncbi:hypothetical protein SXCC_03990 [Gluconacetobacter sp. SXCC-1]|nr:hypothetical protein SXCC_03990 [Gluconacetobacter sp. SXCC-1]